MMVGCVSGNRRRQKQTNENDRGARKCGFVQLADDGGGCFDILLASNLKRPSSITANRTPDWRRWAVCGTDTGVFVGRFVGIWTHHLKQNALTARCRARSRRG